MHTDKEIIKKKKNIYHKLNIPLKRKINKTIKTNKIYQCDVILIWLLIGKLLKGEIKIHKICNSPKYLILCKMIAY